MTTLKEEEPYAAVVDNEFLSITCSKCFAWNSILLENVKLSRCGGCRKLYYCGSECQKADWKDHKAECKLFKSANYLPAQCVRLIMRMIEKSKKHPDFKAFNGRTYDSLKHDSSMRREIDYHKSEAATIYAEICKIMGAKAPDFEKTFLAVFKKANSSYTIQDGSWGCDARGIGIYIGLSVLKHSCRPDAFIVNQGSKMLLRTANKDLVYSEKLTVSFYSGFFFLDTDMRRTKLYDNYFFFCKCEECEDVESDNKKRSGRPVCCPNSWFNIDDRICNSCRKEVSCELAVKAQDAMRRLRGVASVFKEKEGDKSALLALLPEWIQLFDSYKEVLSDENACLFSIVNIIYLVVPLTDFNVSCKYADLCAPYARKRPDCVFSTMLFSRRQQFFEFTLKPPQETKMALNEAIDSAQVVFGPHHELTQGLVQKKTIFDLIDLSIR